MEGLVHKLVQKNHEQISLVFQFLLVHPHGLVEANLLHNSEALRKEINPQMSPIPTPREGDMPPVLLPWPYQPLSCPAPTPYPGDVFHESGAVI